MHAQATLMQVSAISFTGAWATPNVTSVTSDVHAVNDEARAPAERITLDDVRREFGDRWDIAAIAQGYRAILRDPAGRGPVVLYGRTPAELAESVRMAQVPS